LVVFEDEEAEEQRYDAQTNNCTLSDIHVHDFLLPDHSGLTLPFSLSADCDAAGLTGLVDEGGVDRCRLNVSCG
jgi:hypothetical protein